MDKREQLRENNPNKNEYYKSGSEFNPPHTYIKRKAATKFKAAAVKVAASVATVSVAVTVLLNLNIRVLPIVIEDTSATLEVITRNADRESDTPDTIYGQLLIIEDGSETPLEEITIKTPNDTINFDLLSSDSKYRLDIFVEPDSAEPEKSFYFQTNKTPSKPYNPKQPSLGRIRDINRQVLIEEEPSDDGVDPKPIPDHKIIEPQEEEIEVMFIGKPTVVADNESDWYVTYKFQTSATSDVTAKAYLGGTALSSKYIKMTRSGETCTFKVSVPRSRIESGTVNTLKLTVTNTDKNGEVSKHSQNRILYRTNVEIFGTSYVPAPIGEYEEGTSIYYLRFRILNNTNYSKITRFSLILSGPEGEIYTEVPLSLLDEYYEPSTDMYQLEWLFMEDIPNIVFCEIILIYTPVGGSGNDGVYVTEESVYKVG